MLVSTALALVNEMTIFPGWEVRAEDHSNRFEDTICLHFTIPAKRSEREEYPDFATDVPGGARAAFPIHVGDIDDVAVLAFRVTMAAVENFTHEVRETVRIAPTGWAPLHPHREDGINRWARLNGSDPARDYLFGLA